MERTRIVRKREVKDAAAVAGKRLSDLMKEQTRLLEGELAKPFLDREVLVVRRVADGSHGTFLARVIGVSVSYTGFRLVGEYIDPVTGLPVETPIMIDEIAT